MIQKNTGDACARETNLGSGPINLINMAFVMTRNTRKSLKNGVYPPFKSFDAGVRGQNNRPSDWINLHGLMRCFGLKTGRFPAPHAYYPHKFTPTILTKLVGPEPKELEGLEYPS